MTGRVALSRVTTEVRGRVPWRWLPFAAVAGAALTYGLHHAPPFARHAPMLALLVVGVATGVAIAGALLARPAERQLPWVVSLSSTAPEVRPLRPSEVGFCAALHAAALPHGFFAALGHGFLRSYYATFVTSPHAVALVCVVGDAPVGLVVGALDARAHRRWVLRRHGVRLLLVGSAALSLRPRLALRFARTRIARYRAAWQRARSGAERRPAGPVNATAVLTHVAVVPGAEGNGIGSQLVGGFVAAARHAAVDRVVLVTQGGAAGAGGFYRGLGWHRAGDRGTVDDSRVEEYVLDLRRR